MGFLTEDMGNLNSDCNKSFAVNLQLVLVVKEKQSGFQMKLALEMELLSYSSRLLKTPPHLQHPFRLSSHDCYLRKHLSLRELLQWQDQMWFHRNLSILKCLVLLAALPLQNRLELLL